MTVHVDWLRLQGSQLASALRGEGPRVPWSRQAPLKRFLYSGSLKDLAEAVRPPRAPAGGKGRLVTRPLRECCEQAGAALGAKGGKPVLKNVVVIGPESRNRRRYTPEALRQAVSMYEGCRVNLDHPSGSPDAARSVQSRFGKLVNVRASGNKVVADLAYNPAHPFARAVEWFAEHQPDALGLSHNATGQGRDDNGVFVVERVASVRSVDLVADPATTRGLFESLGR